MYVVIEGNIGAGKTTLARHIANEYQADLVLEEFMENPYLPKFYKDERAYAFELEMSFLKSRYHQLTKIFENQSNKLIVSDFHFSKSRIFASVNLNKDEFEKYHGVFLEYRPQIPDPDLVIYLDKPVKALLENINKRGREFEAGISQQYLENIDKTYKKFIHEHDASSLLKVGPSDVFPDRNSHDYKLIVNAINKKL